MRLYMFFFLDENLWKGIEEQILITKPPRLHLFIIIIISGSSKNSNIVKYNSNVK